MAPRNMSPAEVETPRIPTASTSSPVACLVERLGAPCLPGRSHEDSWSARMISTIDGGMIWPSVPDAAIVPVASGEE